MGTVKVWYESCMSEERIKPYRDDVHNSETWNGRRRTSIALRRPEIDALEWFQIVTDSPCNKAYDEFDVMQHVLKGWNYQYSHIKHILRYKSVWASNHIEHVWICTSGESCTMPDLGFSQTLSLRYMLDLLMHNLIIYIYN